MQFVQRHLAGMAKRGMAKIVAQGNGLGEWFVEAQCRRYGAGNLRYFQDMGKPGAVVIAGGGEKYLRSLLSGCFSLSTV
jgi:hypothetical protein